MRILEKFEPIVHTTDDTTVSLGLFDSYGCAYDEAALFAAKELPAETTKAFRIQKVFVNDACFDYTEYAKRGD